MNILGILLILLGTVSNTLSDPIPPTPPEVVAELMRVLFLAADRNDTGTIVETFRLPYGKATYRNPMKTTVIYCKLQ
ncbi:Protein CBG26733 [Caenorhabditis briggsae]|uniref:Protein CBG26733 n=1 Tax=Caenorhabditis briggsae TaxID=6238 RepID=B6IEA8_CAEBR|nr:Protein CBG26733 [Caenorhabditis briggsae]CAS01172.1 Protein CBG26733 [Caenorhabditis briggsae]